jgi:hypothetical protein
MLSTAHCQILGPEPGLNLKKTDDGSPWSLPTAMVADVFHRQWPRVAMLHRAFFAAWL